MRHGNLVEGGEGEVGKQFSSAESLPTPCGSWTWNIPDKSNYRNSLSCTTVLDITGPPLLKPQ